MVAAMGVLGDLPTLPASVTADDTPVLAFLGGARSIAVVGSSGNLLFRGLGPAIDDHDIVVRMNGATVRGYERDVGQPQSHKTIVVGSGNGIGNALQAGLLGFGAFVLGKDESALAVAKAAHAPTALLKRDFIADMHALLGGFIAMGAAVVLGMRLNASVSVYGFGRCVGCNKYYD